MIKRFDGDPLEKLRRADPITPGDVPEDTSGPHARALFQEVTGMDTMERPAVAGRQARKRLLALAGAAAAVVVLVGSISLADGDEAVTGGVPVGSLGLCAEEYSPATLLNRDIAFDGTVTDLEGDSVTFEVTRWFTGGTADTITLEGASLSGGFADTSNEAASFAEGGRYLVSGSDGFVWGCGFTMTYDSAIAQQWADSFGSRR